MAVAAWLCLSGIALADVDAALKMCESCHGEDGIGTGSDVPIIAGMPAAIQELALFAYMNGDRTCGSSPLMCNIVSRLTEDRVVALVEHFAAMPYAPAGEDFDATLAEKGKAIHQSECAACHGAEVTGSAVASILHGQRKNYLRYSLEQYAAGDRKQLPAMEDRTRALSAEDIEALLNYYASHRD